MLDSRSLKTGIQQVAKTISSKVEEQVLEDMQCCFVDMTTMVSTSRTHGEHHGEQKALAFFLGALSRSSSCMHAISKDHLTFDFKERQCYGNTDRQDY